MKTPKFFSLLIVAILFSNCSDDDGTPEPQATCLISQAVVNGTSTITFDYNSSGQIRSVTNYYADGNTRTYTYSGNTILIDLSSESDDDRMRTVTLNGDGLPESVHDGDLDYWTNYAFEYDGTKLVKQIYTNSLGDNEESVLEWDGDNVGALITGYTLEYYLDQPLQPADFLSLQYLVEYGVSPIQNANMVKSYTYGTTTYPFVYDFDEDGNITRMDIGNGETIWEFSYICN